MPESPPPVSAAPAVRRKRRWLRRVLWGLAGTLVLLWMVKVPLGNWILRRLPGDFDITITGIRPGFQGASLKGVRVVHRPTGRQVGYGGEMDVTGGWSRILKGDLGKLSLRHAEVSWRPEFESKTKAPLEPGPPASPLVTWETGEVRDSVFTWYEAGQETQRLSLKVVSLDGERMAIYNDGHVEATGQRVVLTDVVSREFALDGSLEIESRSALVEGVVTGQHLENRFTIETVKLAPPLVNIVWRRGDPLLKGPPVASTEASAPAWDKPVEFLIRDGLSEPGRVIFTVHAPSEAPVEFSSVFSRLTVAGLRAGGGLPFILEAGDVEFQGLKSPGATIEAKQLAFKASMDERARVHVRSAIVNGMTVTDTSRLLASLGVSPEELKSLPVCRSGMDAKCVNLMISGEGISSPDAQQIVLQEFSAMMPGKKEPMAKANRVEVNAVPDEALADRRLRTVAVDKPELKIDQRELSPAIKVQSPQTGNAPPQPPPAVPGAEKPAWFGWRADSLTVVDGQFKATGLGFAVPDATGAFSVKTAARESGGDPFYHIHVQDIALENPLFPTAPFKSAGMMDVEVHPLRFWEQGDVDEIKIDGEKVELNAVFQKLFNNGDKADPGPGKPAPVEEPAPEPPPSDKGAASFLPRWKVKRFVIRNSEVGIPNIGDGRRLVIPIREQVFVDVPLTADLRDNDAAHRVQKVEVPAIYLYAPFNEGQTVAELPVNFVYFTFAGLLEKRIERVELVAPKIKAGQPLFDFIEVTGKRFSEEVAASGQPMPLLAALDSASLPVQQAIAAVRAAGEEKEEVWDIPFFTEDGMVITAPKGLEWTQIPRLPFRNARVREGPQKGQPIPFRLRGDEVHGELAIEPGWYDFPDYKLKVRMSDDGRVVFNFPLKDKDNNLVEVFRNNTILYRNLTIEKVWLSVTYDKTGIYVGFGGETCGGYITGKVNLYLDQLYSWDASASFTGIEMKPLTGKLTREYVLIDGRVDQLNVTAYGDMNGLYQSSAEFKMNRPGRLQVKALDNLRKDFVDKRIDWKDDFGRIGLDLLREFPFLSCEGSAKLFGQEGKVLLKFKSARGSRDFTINLHDYRNRPEKAVIRF